MTCLEDSLLSQIQIKHPWYSKNGCIATCTVAEQQLLSLVAAIARTESGAAPPAVIVDGAFVLQMLLELQLGETGQIELTYPRQRLSPEQMEHS
jgi:hypothetical protein